MIPLIPLSSLQPLPEPEPKPLKMPELPKPFSNFLLKFRDPGRADIHLTVWAQDDDHALEMALQIEASIDCPYAYDCLKLL